MSLTLIHPPQELLHNTDPVSLEGIPPDAAITMLRSLEEDGQPVAAALHLARSSDLIHNAHEDALQVMRAAITDAQPRRETAPHVSPNQLARARCVDMSDTIPPDAVLFAIEEQEQIDTMPESFEVPRGELAFMARCVADKAKRANSEPDRKQAKLTLDWLKDNPNANSVVEEALSLRASRFVMARRRVGRVASRIVQPPSARLTLATSR